MPRSSLIYGLEGQTDSREGIVLSGCKNGCLKKTAVVSVTRLTDFQTMVHNWWVDFAKDCKFNSSVPHNHMVCLRDSLEYFTGSCGLSLGPANLKSSLCRLEGNKFWAFMIHPLPVTLQGLCFETACKHEGLCSINRSWPAHIYSAQKQWWSRYGVVLKHNLHWARKLHCKIYFNFVLIA